MEKLLFSELRILRSNNDDKYNKITIHEDEVKQALVDNANLNALGYNLTEQGKVNLARDYKNNPDMKPLYKRVKELEPDISASPMYPDFPIQVLEMSELEFRLDQLIHYLSTYGLESILEVEVKKGALPNHEPKIDRLTDKHLLKLKRLDYLGDRQINEFVINNVIGKRERLLPNELKIAKQVVKSTNRPSIINIPFKENIGAIYGDTLLNGKLDDRYAALDELAQIVEHPGDVLDITEQLVVKNKYKHFKTSLKRGLVDLIEQFPYAVIEENLASNRWSNKFLGKGGRSRAINRNIALIDYLSFSKFSKDSIIMDLVNQLKNGELMSWNQLLESAYKNKDISEAVRLLSQRPGVFFRQINRLIKNGAKPGDLTDNIIEGADKLKTQSIVSALNNFDGDEEVISAFYTSLIHNLKAKEIPELRNKNIFIESEGIDLNNSKLEITDKMQDGGYIQAGVALKLPTDVKYLRFFTYWNDDRRIDIDLHAAYMKENGVDGHIGWNGASKEDGLVYSGDITHPNAAEYLDIDLDEAKRNGVSKVQFNINSYTSVNFDKIDTIFTGLMVLSQMGQNVKLYDQKNVLFRHDLDNSSMATDYGVLDLNKGLIQIIGTNSPVHNDRNMADIKINLSIQGYLSILLDTQNSNVVGNKEDADVILGLGKSDEEDYINLIDENYFMD